jgi:hypothetical protein
VIAHNNQFVRNEAKKKYSKNWPCDVKDGLRNWQIESLPIWLTAIKIPNVMPGMPRVKKFCGKFSVLVTP